MSFLHGQHDHSCDGADCEEGGVAVVVAVADISANGGLIVNVRSGSGTVDVLANAGSDTISDIDASLRSEDGRRSSSCLASTLIGDTVATTGWLSSSGAIANGGDVRAKTSRSFVAVAEVASAELVLGALVIRGALNSISSDESKGSSDQETQKKGVKELHWVPEENGTLILTNRHPKRKFSGQRDQKWLT